MFRPVTLIDQKAPVGVMDIGSNSVRLVIYDGLHRAPVAIFNEKYMCGLGRNLEQSKQLYPEGVIQARRAIGRFFIIARTLEVGALYMFATAAVREARDGTAFVREIEQMFGYPVDILSGEKEAYYAGLGILSSIPDADGVVADLGGGSLELADIGQNTIRGHVSLPVGVLRGVTGKDVNQALSNCKVTENLHKRTLYAVGGSFRYIARIHAAEHGYPLRIVDRYTVPAKELLQLLKALKGQDGYHEALYQLINPDRRPTIPFIAQVMEELLVQGKPERVSFSANGVREGVLFSQLTDEEREQDPALAAAKGMAIRVGSSPAYGEALTTWMMPLYPKEKPRAQILRHIACVLSEFAAFEHTEYRAELAFTKFLDASITGLSHQERVFIATALYYRYAVQPPRAAIRKAQTLLSREGLLEARTLGLALRLGHTVTAGCLELVGATRCQLREDNVLLTFKEGYRALCSDVVMKRLTRLASSLGRKVRVEYEE